MIEEKVRTGLSRLSSKLLSNLSSEKKEVFSIKDAEAASGERGLRLRKLLCRLTKSKWVKRIERGKYLILHLESGLHAGYGADTYMLARKLANPYYIGFLSALNYYGITEQISRIVFIVATKSKRPMHFQAQEYRFVKLPEKRFFGVTEEWAGQLKFNISNREKTVIDCLFLPKYSGGLTEVAKAFRNKLDFEKLYNYALEMDDLATVKRLGYILDILKIKTPVVKELLSKVRGGFCLLDTGGPKTGHKNRKWKIIENIPKEELMVEL